MSLVALFKFSFSTQRRKGAKDAKKNLLKGFVCNIFSVQGFGFCTLFPGNFKKLCALCAFAPLRWIFPPTTRSTTP